MLEASFKNPIRSFAENLSLCSALKRKSAISLLAFARSTIKSLSNLSALALLSAIPAAILASSATSFANFFNSSALFLTDSDKLSTPRAEESRVVCADSGTARAVNASFAFLIEHPHGWFVNTDM